MAFNPLTDRDLVEDIFTGDADITHVTSDRFAQETKEALRDILDKYDYLSEYEWMYYDAERHIEKLEAMLDRRKARYKKWGDD